MQPVDLPAQHAPAPRPEDEHAVRAQRAHDDDVEPLMQQQTDSKDHNRQPQRLAKKGQ